jgi:hypothetical protein
MTRELRWVLWPGPRANEALHPTSLETRKVYQELPDPDAEGQGLVRVIDESGEDYLFPKSMFLPVELSGEASAMLLKAS